MILSYGIWWDHEMSSIFHVFFVFFCSLVWYCLDKESLVESEIGNVLKVVIVETSNGLNNWLCTLNCDKTSNTFYFNILWEINLNVSYLTLWGKCISGKLMSASWVREHCRDGPSQCVRQTLEGGVLSPPTETWSCCRWRWQTFVFRWNGTGRASTVPAGRKGMRPEENQMKELKWMYHLTNTKVPN